MLLALQVLCGGCRLGFVRAPLIFFVFPPLFGLCSCLPNSRSAVCGCEWAAEWSVQYSDSGSKFNRVDTHKENGRVARSVFLPGRFSRGWPSAFTLASRIAALRSVTKSGLFIPRTLLSRLRELTSQAKRPAPGPTLAGAGANSDATIIKNAEIAPEHRSGLSVLA